MISDPIAPGSPSTLYVGLAQDGGNAASPVGLLKLARNGVMESGEFAYGRRYLAEPASFPLNPDYLPLRDAPFLLPTRRLRDGGALPLTLRDALPDSWGRKVPEIQQGRPLVDVEALLLTNEDRVGACTAEGDVHPRGQTPHRQVRIARRHTRHESRRSRHRRPGRAMRNRRATVPAATAGCRLLLCWTCPTNPAAAATSS